MIPRVQPGDVLGDKFRIVREIGRGGMGVVVAADHLHLPQQVAIKLLKGNADAEQTQRFVREARTVVRIKSEHVCRVLDVGALPNGEPFIVMELLEGEDLSARVKRTGALAIPDAVDMIIQASEGVAAAHLLGVVHRDLKPSNLFVTEGVDGKPLVKVLDFRISKSTIHDDKLTVSGALLGSPRFMSPEQLQSTRSVDLRTDVWAMGVVLYELLTGEAAFAGDTAAELFISIIQSDPASLKASCPRAPDGLVAAVRRCVAKSPDERFGNMAELACALAPFAHEHSRALIERICRMYEARGWKRPAPKQANVSPQTAPRFAQTVMMVAASESHASRPMQPQAAALDGAQRWVPGYSAHSTTAPHHVPSPTTETGAPPRHAGRSRGFAALGLGVLAVVGIALGIAGPFARTDDVEAATETREAAKDEETESTAPFGEGASVEVNWRGTWYRARILGVENDLYEIHYDGWDDSYDEAGVPASRIRKLKRTQASGGELVHKGRASACRADTELEVTYAGGSYRLPGPQGKMPVVTSWALKKAAGQYQIYLANWALSDPKFPIPGSLTTDQMYVRVDLRNDPVERPLDATTWGNKGDSEHNVSAGVFIRQASIWLSASALHETGTVEVVYAGDDEICGQLELHEYKTTIRGHFIADVK